MTSLNPYDPKRITGGSSSGSAAVVCAGLCPVALGVDGGGSVRMPAALCGVVGLKPSFGRVSHSGVILLNWTVGMVGVLAGTVEDSLIVYVAMSGEAETAQSPMVSLPFRSDYQWVDSGHIYIYIYSKMGQMERERKTLKSWTSAAHANAKVGPTIKPLDSANSPDPEPIKLDKVVESGPKDQ